MDNERLFLSKCRSVIDEKLGWGDSREWQSQDFENLSDRIFEETTVLLSSTTLKRIWGKVPYDSVPNLSTLNALVQFDLPGGNFSLLARLQNTYKKSNGICQQTFVTVMGTAGIIMVPLTRIGCVGEIGLMIGMNYINGKTNDLSAFGVDFTTEVQLRLESRNGMLDIYVNEKLAYRTGFKNSIGRIVGAKVKFMGTGTVNQFEFKKG
ncbi:hypothetical protein A4H97_11300 [Niastella yeongjuensis]|uniref:Uncharacterized protein n=1 Tax=Niastella yeongjuensis TaxID=354355 RepID=A0A1V9E9U0_9BACT|nr:hypothetical protein [Niastella yeongjuensis]OQP42744.1 hypothetical protein A4H97_11300 [Niastella yeongjuensis]SEO52190.1 hypothetical protein SAMN05660816_02927 [Niastella yeongjuensis]